MERSSVPYIEALAILGGKWNKLPDSQKARFKAKAVQNQNAQIQAENKVKPVMTL